MYSIYNEHVLPACVLSLVKCPCISHVFLMYLLMYISCISHVFWKHVFLMYFKTCISHVFLMYFSCISWCLKWEINVFLMYFQKACFLWNEKSMYFSCIFLDLDVLDFLNFQNTWEIHEKYMFWLKSSFLLLIFYLWGSKNTWEIHEIYMRNTLIFQSVFCNVF